MKNFIKRFCKYGSIYALFMMLCILYSIRVLGYSGPLDVFEGVRAGGESILWNLTKDFCAEEELLALPENLVAKVPFKEWNYVQIDTINVEDSVYLKEKNIKNIVGLTDTETKTVYLSSNDAEAHFAFSHEIGHVVDYSLGWLSRTSEFQAIYEKEADSYADANYHQAPHYASSSSYEFFASVFCDILLGNEKNIESVPETVAYIKAVVGDDKDEKK